RSRPGSGGRRGAPVRGGAHVRPGRKRRSFTHVTGSIVRTLVVGFGLVTLLTGAPAPAAGQWLVTDARRIGMGGLSLGRSGSVARYNPAYRAVSAKAEQRHGQPKLTIPIPLGIIQFLHDHPHLSSDPAFDRKSPGFNPILVVNTILNLPLYLEVTKC